MLIGIYSCLLNKGSNSGKITKKDYIDDETVFSLLEFKLQKKTNTMSTVDMKKKPLERMSCQVYLSLDMTVIIGYVQEKF